MDKKASAPSASVNKSGKYVKGLVVACVLLFVFPLLINFLESLGIVAGLSTYIINLVAFMMVFGIMAMGLDIIAGYLGLGTLGHAAFMGSTAYCTAILAGRYHHGFFTTLLWSLVFAAVISVVFAFLTTKISGITFLMVNLALGLVVWGVAYRWTSFTGGDNGLGGIPRPSIFGYTFDTPIKFYYFLYVFFVLVIVLLYRLVNAPYGLSLHGIRNSPKRMRALGFNVYGHRFLAYVISGTVAGLSGIMLAYYNQFVGPNTAHVTTSSKAYLMVLVGGTATLLGPIIGAFFVVFLENFVSTVTERWVMILAAMYIICVMFTPKGIIGVVESVRKRARDSRFKSGSEDEAPEQKTQ